MSCLSFTKFCDNQANTAGGVSILASFDHDNPIHRNQYKELIEKYRDHVDEMIYLDVSNRPLYKIMLEKLKTNTELSQTDIYDIKHFIADVLVEMHYADGNKDISRDQLLSQWSFKKFSPSIEDHSWTDYSCLSEDEVGLLYNFNVESSLGDINSLSASDRAKYDELVEKSNRTNKKISFVFADNEVQFYNEVKPYLERIRQMLPSETDLFDYKTSFPSERLKKDKNMILFSIASN